MMDRRPLIESVPVRWRMPLAIALGAGLVVALYFLGLFLRDEPTPHADPVKHFMYGSTGGDRTSGFPLAIWNVLPALFPEYLPGGKYLREAPYAPLGFIYEAGEKLPIGTAQRNFQGIDRVFLNCAICHAGTLRTAPDALSHVIPGMGANTVDLQAFERFLFQCVTDERFTPDRLLAAIETMGGRLDRTTTELLRGVGVYLMRERLLLLRDRFRFMDREPDCGPGRVDTFNPPKVLLNFPMDKVPEREWVGNCDLPSVWLQRPREGMWLHWDGNCSKVEERNRSAAFGTGAQPPSLDRRLMKRVADYLADAEPPKFREHFPAHFDQAKAQRGQPLYERYCAECHGRNGRDFSGAYVGKVTPINAEALRVAGPALGGQVAKVTPEQADQLRTDRWRLDSYSHELAAGQNQLYAEYGEERFSHFRKTFGYANAPLDGIWLRAPYLHNGSVPTLRDLLEPSARRPSVFYRGYDVYDPVRAGWVSDVAVEPATSAKTNPQLAGRRYFRFDTRAIPGEQAGAFAKVIAIDPATRVLTLDRPLIRATIIVKVTDPAGRVLLWDIPVARSAAGESTITLAELPPELSAGSGLDYSTPRERNEGNGNYGHEYGTGLTPEQKDAIVEYLKSF
jgi:mono/diheme cytochrome c family protein